MSGVVALALVSFLIWIFSGDDATRESRLYKVIGCDRPDRVADVVFVHGLDGDYKSTWHPRGKPEDYFPKWFGEDNPQVGVWSFDYPANKFVASGGTMAIVDRARNLLTALSVNGLGQDHQKPLIFVTHSLGGLVVKQALEISSDSPNVEWSEIVRTTNGVVFIATPNSGSDVANLLDYVAGKFTSVSVEELRNSNPNLLELNRWYVRNVKHFGIRTLPFCEIQKTGPFIVVTQASADPGIPDVEVIPLDHDHVSITKPQSQQALLYLAVNKFVSAGLGARQLTITLDMLLRKLEANKEDPKTVIQGLEGGRVRWPVTLQYQVSGATPYYEVVSARENRVKHRILFYVQDYLKLTPTGPLTFEGTIDAIRYNRADGEWVISLIDSSYAIP